MISADLNIILPEIVLAGFALLGLLGAVYTSKDKAAGVLVWVTAVVMDVSYTHLTLPTNYPV